MNFIKKRLSNKDKALFKLACWACAVVWMVFYIGFGIAVSPTVSNIVKQYSQPDWLGNILAYIAPAGLILTIVLTCVIFARWMNRKLRNYGKED